MTTRVVLEIPGEANPQSIEIGDGDNLIVGRAPTAGAGKPVLVAAPSVSANHVSIRRAEGTVTVTDERSRNGTLLRLPAGDPVTIKTEQALVLRLGSGVAVETVARQPADAAWTGRDDFHLAVVQAVTAWFKAQGVPARVEAVPHADPGDRELPGQIPLANGFDLSVVPLRTMDHRWEGMADALWSYAGTQNMIFATEEHTRGEGMVLVSPAIRRVHRTVVDAAQRGLRVLLFGPSGSGKDGLARCYHRSSGRGGAFVAKNCSMFTREFLRVELFGAEKGAYTGATRSIVGAVERAHGGTLFLDEVGELPAEVQAMLLTFLDHGEYERFGASGMVRTADVRIVSATNRDLRNVASTQVFREDLWYRIAGQVIEVPALRERPDDIEAFLKLTRLGGHTLRDVLTDGAHDLLLAHPWPGNFRELKSFVAHVPAGATPGSIDAATCETMLRRVSLSPGAVSSSPVPTGKTLDLSRLAAAAAEAFRADQAHGLVNWDDVKQYIESYLKPLLFAALSGATTTGNHDGAEIAALAAVIDADRGTVRKHLARFLERFTGTPLDE